MERFQTRRKRRASPRDPRSIKRLEQLWLHPRGWHWTFPEIPSELPGDREIGLKRIDMIMAHDALSRLGDIKQPILVVCGEHNFCTPLPLSEEIARTIPGARLVVFAEGGELIELEQDERYFEVVGGFLREQANEPRC